jgi:hypothetical protein
MVSPPVSVPIDADEEELIVLATRVPERIRKRVLQSSDSFWATAACDDKTLDKLMKQIGPSPKKTTKRSLR